jgi:hypothetical protein
VYYFSLFGFVERSLVYQTQHTAPEGMIMVDEQEGDIRGSFNLEVEYFLHDL